MRRIPALIDLWRRGAGRDQEFGPLDPVEIERVAGTLIRLQRGLTSDRMLAGSGYMDEREYLGAYLLYYWPVSYLETSLSLSMLNPSRPIRRVLDLGSGPGPVSAAFADLGANSFSLLDGSSQSLEIAERLLPRTTSRQVVDIESGSPLPPEPFDAIVAGHVLNELWKDQPKRIDLRCALIEEAGTRLEAGGFFLALEPATLAASRDLLALRDLLASRGWSILAPCPHSLPCPALAAGSSRSCHGEVPWSPPEPIASIAHRAGLDRNSVKWSWFAATAPQGLAANSRSAVDPTVDPTNDLSTASSFGPARVVSDALLNKAGRLRLMLCYKGRLDTLSVPSSSPIALRSGFTSLRRYDLVVVSSGEDRAGGIGLVEDSRLDILESGLET
jgi:SAM-dependent methyltransferase